MNIFQFHFVDWKIITNFVTIKQYKNKTLNKYSNIDGRRQSGRAQENIAAE